MAEFAVKPTPSKGLPPEPIGPVLCDLKCDGDVCNGMFPCTICGDRKCRSIKWHPKRYEDVTDGYAPTPQFVRLRSKLDRHTSHLDCQRVLPRTYHARRCRNGLKRTANGYVGVYKPCDNFYVWYRPYKCWITQKLKDTLDMYGMERNVDYVAMDRAEFSDPMAGWSSGGRAYPIEPGRPVKKISTTEWLDFLLTH